MNNHTTINDIPKGREGWVYLLWAQGTNRYKIGRSVNPIVRHQAISRQSPLPLIMLDCFWTIDAVNDEMLYHKQNASRRVYGEWFEIDDERSEIDQNRSQASFFDFWKDDISHFFCYVPSPTIGLLFNTSEKYLSAFFGGQIHVYALDLLFSLYKSAASRGDFVYINSLIRNVIPELIQCKGVQSVDDMIIGILVGGHLRLLDQQKILQQYPKELRFTQ